MKPKEFDELIRHKFDQNDFEYNPRNWEKLEEQMDGRAKKRSILMWWLMPAAGIAASVALAMVAPTIMQEQGSRYARSYSNNIHEVRSMASVHGTTIETNSERNIQYTQAAKKSNKHTANTGNRKEKAAVEENEEKFAINYFNAVRTAPTRQKANINLLNNKPEVTKEKEKNKKVAANEPMVTFKPEDVLKPQPKLSIILSGGISQGSKEGGKGYTAGAGIRKMISRNVYVEGNVAFANSSIAQDMPYRDEWIKTHYWQNGKEIPPPGVARTTNIGDASNKEITTTETLEHSGVKVNKVSYDLSYVQINPSIGFKVMKKVSLGVGPDFQQALSDNRPEPSATNPGINRKLPMFDMGLIGKTEISFTKQVKAGVAYRKGINNVLTPMGKFIDRDYVQFEVKCAIFNK